LTLHDASIYVKGIKLATVQKIDFCTLLFYTNIEVTELLLDESLKNIAPTTIDRVSLSHAAWNPLHLGVDAEGSFGKVDGNVAIAGRTLRLDFNETKNIKMLKANLKEDEKGWYYETSF